MNKNNNPLLLCLCMAGEVKYNLTYYAKKHRILCCYLGG